MIKFQSFLSGSSGNATFVTDDHVHFLVDCGAGGRYITECMRRIGISPSELSGIFITHEHHDHIAGAGILSRKFGIPIYATEKTWDAMENALGNILPHNKRILEGSLDFDTVRVSFFPIPHDAADPVGYSFETLDGKFSIATDMGHISETVMAHIKGSDSVILEANHDVEMLQKGPYPFHLKKRILGDKGHLSNELCGKMCVSLAKTGTKAVWLGHLSGENNRPELAFETVSAVLKEENVNGLSLNVLPKQWIGL